ncbi:MAG: nuclear transport factor 2 family protein [Actinomycetota bacterium]|jgi:hypothetical protein|nr:nuclear transport factor 2 family protein [Actinomycetota bacterium]
MTDAAMQEMLDNHQIHKVLVDYCRGIDRCDVELVASVYHDDAIDDHGIFRGLGKDFAPFAVDSLPGMYDATQHTVFNTNIDFADSTTAHVETYVVAYHTRRDDQGDILETLGGRYVDRFEKRDGVWKIADRLVLKDWDKREHVSRYAGKIPQGGRKPDDPSYTRR